MTSINLGPLPKRGRPRIGSKKKTAEVLKPWLKAGLSRRTWYRRRAERRLAQGPR